MDKELNLKLGVYAERQLEWDRHTHWKAILEEVVGYEEANKLYSVWARETDTVEELTQVMKAHVESIRGW